MLLLLAVMLTGCQKNAADTTAPAVSKAKVSVNLEAHLTSVQEKADTLKASLENDALTQTDMNLKAQELLEIWEAALSDVLNEAKNILSEDEYAKLTDEQSAWIQEKEKAAEAAGKEFEGGSLHALTVNMEAARITQERVYALYELLK